MQGPFANVEASCVNVETEFANVLRVRNDSVSRLRLYSRRARAFADLGLAPEGDPADLS